MDTVTGDKWLAEKTWLAPAKLNLFLHVTGRRADGHHTLQTAFVLLDHFDELKFRINDSGEIRRHDVKGGIEIDLPVEDLCLKAAKALQAHTGTHYGATVQLKKNISAGAGLGGGSSDAATTLLALNKLWEAGLSRAELIELGRSLGADVPVFVFGENALALGVGDQLQALDYPEQLFCVLVPNIHVSTAEIFSDSSLTRDTPIKTIRGSLQSGQNSDLRNDLEPVTCRRYPAVDQALSWLRKFGEARMSGTGASVFLACDTLGSAEEILHQLPTKFGAEVDGFVARSLLRHPHKSE